MVPSRCCSFDTVCVLSSAAALKDVPRASTPHAPKKPCKGAPACWLLAQFAMWRAPKCCDHMHGQVGCRKVGVRKDTCFATPQYSLLVLKHVPVDVLAPE